MHGIVDEKTNVFAFGVLLLELITGRQPIDSSQQSLVMWAKSFIESRNIRGLADPYLSDKYNVHQMSCVAFTASLWVQQAPQFRPCMGHVLQLLRSEEENLQCVEQWITPLSPSPFMEESFDTEEYTSTRLLFERLGRRFVSGSFECLHHDEQKYRPHFKYTGGSHGSLEGWCNSGKERSALRRSAVRGSFGAAFEILNVCDNLADHMVGNVYVKSREEEQVGNAL